MLLQLMVVIEVTGKEPSWHKMTPIGDEPVEEFANRVRDAVVHLEAGTEDTSKDLPDADVRRSAADAAAVDAHTGVYPEFKP